MKKYNLSRIMKRAWELVKKIGMTISSGLKQSWREEKAMAKGSSGFDKRGSLPRLEGSEKQVKWAQDIRSGYLDAFEKDKESVLSYQKIKDAEGKARKDYDDGRIGFEAMEKHSKKYKQSVINTEFMERIVDSVHPTTNPESFVGFVTYTTHTSAKNKEIREKYKKLKAGLQKGDPKLKALREKKDQEYRKWLVDEYRKVLRTQKSAKWWIEHR